MFTYCSTTQKGTREIWSSAISIHNQLSEPVEVGACGLSGLSRCHQRSEHRGDCEGNGMGWHCDSCPGTGGGEKEMREL